MNNTEHPRNPLSRWTARFMVGIAALLFAFSAFADPPGRAARLAYITGQISFSPAGEDEWAQAIVNRPLTTGDRLWADTDGRTEVQVGQVVLRMGASTSVTLLNLDDDIAQFELAQGVLHLRVRRLEAGQTVEVDTPNLAFTVREAGEYKIEVDAAGTSTLVVVRSGSAEVYGDGASYTVSARQAFRFAGSGLADYQSLALPAADSFELWAVARDRKVETSVTARYVSREVVGYEELDDNGTWVTDAEYGRVWTPTRVAVDWAPYRDGHWAWVEPWGWTWVDDQPWGYAVSHYGRWAHAKNRWVWVPGPIRTRPVYAPALVAFVGGGGGGVRVGVGGGVGVGVGVNVGGAVSAMAWFPLAPREIYRPAYVSSPRYFERVNVSNTVIQKNVNITNVYNNVNVTNVTYKNQRVKGAVVAVPQTAFVQSQSVSKVRVKVDDDVVVKSTVVHTAQVAPLKVSVTGGQKVVDRRPPPTVVTRAVVARTAPPPQKVSFAVKQAALEKNPGKPLDDKEVDTVRKQVQQSKTVDKTVDKDVDIDKRVRVVKADKPKAAPPAKPGASAADRKEAAADKAAADKAADRKEAADKAAADKAADRKEAADKAAADRKEAAEKTAADRKEAAEKKAAADQKAAADRKADAAEKAAAERKDAADKKAATDPKAAAAEKAAADRKEAAEKKAAADQKAAAERKENAAEKAAADRKEAAEQKAATEKKAAAERKEAAEASRPKPARPPSADNDAAKPATERAPRPERAASRAPAERPAAAPHEPRNEARPAAPNAPEKAEKAAKADRPAKEPKEAQPRPASAKEAQRTEQQEAAAAEKREQRKHAKEEQAAKESGGKDSNKN